MFLRHWLTCSGQLLTTRHTTASRSAYVLAAFILFTVEVCIAVFVRDGVIRPYVGDVLAVMLVYCTLRAITPLRIVPAIIATLGIALAIELAQLFNLLDLLALRGNAVARIILGGSFDLLDLAAYAAGGVLILIAEAFRARRP